jgi:outer membrane protein TolC
MTHRRLPSILTIAVLLFVAAPVHAQKKSAEVKKLLKERSELLDKATKKGLAMYEAGTLTVADLLRLHQDAIRAKLDYEDNPKERIALLRASAQTFETIAKTLETRLKLGNGREIDVLRAQAAVLEARAELLQEEERQKPGK